MGDQFTAGPTEIPKIAAEVAELFGRLPECGDAKGRADKFGANIRKQAEAAFDITYSMVCEKSGIKILAMIVAVFAMGVTFLIAVLGGLLTVVLTPALASLGTAMLELLGRTRQQAAPGLNQLLIATLNEMFGVEFTADDLPQGEGVAAARERARVIGGKVIGLLEEQFVPEGTLSPEQGKNAAEMFTGFTANFTIVSALIAVLGEMVSMGQIEAFRELGVELAQNLGLGRMSRRGMTELVSTVVADPYEGFLNRKYRPKMLGPSQAIKAFFDARMSEEALYEELARAGYSTERINQLVEQARPDLDLGEIDILLRYKAWDEDQAVQYLMRKGADEDTARVMLRVHDLKRVDSLMRAHVDMLRKQVEDGVLDTEQFASALETLPLTDEERKAMRVTLGQRLELPRRFLSFAQVQSAFEQGVIDVSEVEDFLAREGYSADDRKILVILTLLRAAREAAAEEEAERRRRARQAKATGGKAPSPGTPLTGTEQPPPGG